MFRFWLNRYTRSQSWFYYFYSIFRCCHIFSRNFVAKCMINFALIYYFPTYNVTLFSVSHKYQFKIFLKDVSFFLHVVYESMLKCLIYRCLIYTVSMKKMNVSLFLLGKFHKTNSKFLLLFHHVE